MPFLTKEYKRDAELQELNNRKSIRKGVFENMGNKKKRLLIGIIIFIGMCLAVFKLNLVQVVYAKVDDAMSDTKTICFNQDNWNDNGKAVVSPDLKQVAFCKGTQEFFVKELSTGIITTYSTEEKIYQLKYSPDGTYLAAGRNVLNTKTGKVTHLATDAILPSTSDYIAFSPNSEKLALVNEEQVQYPRPTIIEIWNLEKEQLVQKLSSGYVINQIAFSKNGRCLAVAGDKITLWDIQEGKPVKKLVTDSMPADNELLSHIDYQAIAYSPDGKHLAAVLRSSYRNGKSINGQSSQTEVIEIWDAEQGRVDKTLEWDTPHDMKKLQYSPDGKYIASGKGVNRSEEMIRDAVWIWDVSRGQVVKKLTQFPDYNLTGMDYSADGSHLSASGHWNTKIWRIK